MLKKKVLKPTSRKFSKETTTNHSKPLVRFWINHDWPRDLTILTSLWILNAAVQILWLNLDHSIPSWDPAKHLIGSLNYGWTLQDPQWSSDLWWERFWMLSSSYPPLLYIVTAPLQNWLGPGADQAIVINLGFNALLLVSVYGLGRQLFTAEVGVWAAILCIFFPRLYTASLDYLLDYSLTALAIWNFYSLTCWQNSRKRIPQGYWSLILGLGIGLILLLKQTILLFFLFPLAWCVGINLWKRQWERLLQFGIASLVILCIIWPWVSTNWVFMIGAGGNSLGKAARNEGDPAFNTLAAWTYYLKDLPNAISWPLLIVSIGGLLLGLGKFVVQQLRQARSSRQALIAVAAPVQDTPPSVGEHPTVLNCRENDHQSLQDKFKGLLWLGLYILGGYLLWCLIPNKDNRYMMPCLPALAIVLASGLLHLKGRSGQVVRVVTVSLAACLMVLNLFALGELGDRLTSVLAPAHARPPHLGAPWSHPDVIEHVIQTSPYQLSNLGLLTSSIQVNAETLNYYGTLRNFQVYTRGVGNRRSFGEKDVRSLAWFIAQVDPEEKLLQAVEPGPRIQVLQAVDQSPEFERDRTWLLPDGTQLYLYRRKTLPIQVEPLEKIPETFPGQSPTTIAEVRAGVGVQRQQSDVGVAQKQPIYLTQVELLDRVRPGEPIPVTYEWMGSWQALHRGMVLLTWRQQLPPQPRENQPTTLQTELDFWIHDHGIGLGTLRPGPIQANQFTFTAAPIENPQQWFQVREHTAMLPPIETTSGIYALEAVYLNPQSGQMTPLTLPIVTLVVDPQAPSIPGPELDWVTQMRELAKELPKGIDGLNLAFDQLGHINLYDPIQNYLVQAEKTLEIRLQQQPENLDYAYALMLARVMQRKVDGAIEALDTIIALDPENPYAHAYLAFVNLYALRPGAAQKALEPALALKPDSAEIQGLSAAASLLQGNVVDAWFTKERALSMAE